MVMSGAGLAQADPGQADPGQAPQHVLPVSKSGDLVVGLCDGQTSVEVKGVKPGEPLNARQGKTIADALMAEWKKKNAHTAGVSAWVSDPEPAAVTLASNTGDGHGNAIPAPQKNVQGATYSAYTGRDEEVWRALTKQFVESGNKIFHDASALGGTIAVSCDMCHPNAANTHPETYPKFQVQLGRVALLRDMINWCIENPVRGRPLSDDDPKLRALEAYIYAQRQGVPLSYGKH